MKRPFMRAQMCLMAAMAILTLAAPAHGAKQVNEKTDVVIIDFIPCAAGGAGEVVDLSGPLHTVITYTIDGNNVSGYSHFQPQNIVGVGETTGETYHATGATIETFKTSLHNGQANMSFVNNFRMIGQGPGNNFLEHDTVHINFNADGTVTVFHDNFSVSCQ